MFNTIKVNNTDTNYTHSIFDISEYTSKTYDTLSDALTDVPDGKQSGGMTVRFVSTSDNKYVQYRLMSNSFTTDVTQWQGVNEEPIPDSKSLVESGGVYKFLAKDIIAKVTSPSYTNGIVYTNGTINSSVSGYGYTNAIELKSGETLHLNNDNSIYHGGDVALLYKCDANGDWIETLITGGTSYVTKKETYTNKTGSTIYVAICAYTNSLGYYIDTISKATSENVSLIGWLLSESYTIRGIITSSEDGPTKINITYPNGYNGVLNITRNSDGMVIKIVGDLPNKTLTYNIIRNSDGDVTSTNIVLS